MTLNPLMIGLIGKGALAREVYASMLRDGWRQSAVQLLNDLDGTLQATLNHKDPYRYYLCIGDPQFRRKMYNSFNISFANCYTSARSHILDPMSVSFGSGSIVCAGSSLSCNIKTGMSTLINLNCTVGHDVTIGDFVTISPGVNVSGNCKIGNNVSIGSNSVLKENITIADNVTIGMGSVVTKDIIEPGVYVGNPCKRLR